MVAINKDKADYLLSILKKLEYGSLLITVHGGDITQVDIHEKMRLIKPPKKKV